VSLISELFNLLFPETCHCCERIGPRLCGECRPQPFLGEQLLLGRYCLICGESLLPASQLEELELCIHCRLMPLPKEVLLRSIWRYSERTERPIKALKYAGKYQLAGFFQETLIGAIRAGAFPVERRWSWDLLLAVPSTDSALRNRGYGHMVLIARPLARALKLPFSPFALTTYGKHPQQASLKIEERLKHLSRKFRADEQVVRGKHVLLIDDVITTGASVIGSALALLGAGALSVDILSIARTEHFSISRASLYERLPRKKHSPQCPGYLQVPRALGMEGDV